MAEHRLAGRPGRRGWFGRGRTRALLSTGILVGTGAVATLAYWQEQATVAGVVVQSGAMHIDLAANNQVKPETYAWTGLNLIDLTPSESVAAVLPVSNNSDGDLTFTYRIQAAATGPLGAALQVTVRRGGTSNGTTCSGGTLVGTAGSALAGFDQPAGVALAPGGTHNICVQVTRPASPAFSSGATSSVTFTFPATQVVA